MPTSWSIAAAQSSCCSPGSGSNRPPATSDSCIWSASRATCSECCMSASYWIARLRTAAARTSSNRGSPPARQQRVGEEHALAQSGLGHLHALEAPVEEHRLERHRRREDDVAAAGL